jgi:osmotically-inducible protein OsmY
MVRLKPRLSLLAVLPIFLASPVAIWAQVNVNVDRSSSRAVPARSLEAALYLQLRAHPATARREIEVRVRDGKVELRGAVGSEHEHLVAERLATLTATDQEIVNRLRVQRELGPPSAAVAVAQVGSPDELEQRYREQLGREFSADWLKQIELSVYTVTLETPASATGRNARARTPENQVNVGLAVVVEGTLPSASHQLAMSELILSSRPAVAAVINRTYLAFTGDRQPRAPLRIRVPFFRMDLDRRQDGGVDLDLASPGGPVRVRGAGKRSQADDQELADGYIGNVRADVELEPADLRCNVLAGVLTIEGKLQRAGLMRAVAIARRMEGVRGLVDRTETLAGGPRYHTLEDLTEYLNYRLGEHADAWDIAISPAPDDRLKLRATVPTTFHAAMAATVVGQDPALAPLPLDLEFAEWTPSPEQPVAKPNG